MKQKVDKVVKAINILLEYCYDHDERVRVIKEIKPKHEIKTRLRLLKPVKAKLPDDLVRVWQKYTETLQKYYKARQKYDKAWQEYDKARQKYDKCLSSHKTFLEELHKKGREWNGKEIVF